MASRFGGAWNFDPENRETFAWWQKAGRSRGRSELRVKSVEITRKVIAMVKRESRATRDTRRDFGCRLTKRVRGSGLDASFASGCRVSAFSKT